MVDQYIDLQILSTNVALDPAELQKAVDDHGLSDRPYEIVSEGKSDLGFHVRLKVAGDEPLVVKIGQSESVGAGDSPVESIVDVSKFNMFNQPGYFGAMVICKLVLLDEVTKSTDYVIVWRDLRTPGAPLRWDTEKVEEGDEPFSTLKDLDDAKVFNLQEFEQFCWSLPVSSDEQDQQNRRDFIKHAEENSNA